MRKGLPSKTFAIVFTVFAFLCAFLNLVHTSTSKGLLSSWTGVVLHTSGFSDGVYILVTLVLGIPAVISMIVVVLVGTRGNFVLLRLLPLAFGAVWFALLVGFHSDDSISPLVKAVFYLSCLVVLVLFAACAWATREGSRSVSFIAAAIVSVLALGMMLMGVPPFGDKEFFSLSSWNIYYDSMFLVVALLTFGTAICLIVPEREKKLFSRAKTAATQSSPNAGHASNGSITSVSQELKDYKALLDEGALTQEEFEAKKRELLGLEK